MAAAVSDNASDISNAVRERNGKRCNPVWQ